MALVGVPVLTISPWSMLPFTARYACVVIVRQRWRLCTL